MRDCFLILSLILFPLLTLHSQELTDEGEKKWNGFLYPEAGFVFPDGTIRDRIAIRQNISSYYVDQTSDGHVSSETNGYFIGLGYEYYISRFRTGFSTGLRFTGFRTQITGNSSERADFFYLRYSMVDTDTRFARVKKITESLNLLSIPVELSVTPFEFGRIGLFARAGVEFNIINPAGKRDIRFQNETMEVNQDDILKNISDQPGKFYSTLYGSVGITLNNENRIRYRLEVYVPSLFLSRDNFSLTEVNSFNGVRFSVQMPLH